MFWIVDAVACCVRLYLFGWASAFAHLQVGCFVDVFTESVIALSCFL
uniref:Uncharacterized protein n=1 Tax=Parascaris equorum TaxID=6256 RepID=A0A914RQQ7_PAREQ